MEDNILDRTLYKQIKNMKRDEMEAFLKRIFENGYKKAVNEQGTSSNLFSEAYEIETATILYDECFYVTQEPVWYVDIISLFNKLHWPDAYETLVISDVTGKAILDSSAIARVFSNIINNAVKYSDRDLFVSMDTDGKIIFSNTAKELSTVEVGKLFDRFFTVDSAKKSTGLGLAIAKTLVEQMNGKIEASYENEKLSIFIYFPCEISD